MTAKSLHQGQEVLPPDNPVAGKFLGLLSKCDILHQE
jgi:hypothetical protein